jgi:hypothetical protein
MGCRSCTAAVTKKEYRTTPGTGIEKCIYYAGYRIAVQALKKCREPCHVAVREFHA